MRCVVLEERRAANRAGTESLEQRKGDIVADHPGRIPPDEWREDEQAEGYTAHVFHRRRRRDSDRVELRTPEASRVVPQREVATGGHAEGSRAGGAVSGA